MAHPQLDFPPRALSLRLAMAYGAEGVDAPERPSPAGAARPGAAIPAFDVLVIDDDESMREMLVSLLETSGYSALAVGSGQEGLDALEAMDVAPRVLLLDLIMPGMSGEEFVREMRRRPRVASVPVVLFSGAGGLESRCKELACAGWLQKPAGVFDLIDWISRWAS